MQESRTGLSDLPLFTVIMATFNRGRHILPSIESVLQQTHTAFELLVIGDGCTDETGEIVAQCGDPRVSWTNLSMNGGSQSFPNNAGIAAARGRFIAYIGHDDIWSLNHLDQLAAAFDATPGLDVAVSGCILHAPPEVDFPGVTGIFEDQDSALRHFFPPSSFAHRRDLTDRIGLWGDPMSLRKPVDAELLYRAATNKMSFRSTGMVTVHKFTAAQRYLSYLSVVSDEQRAMLESMQEPGFEAFTLRQVQLAKDLGRFMYIPNGPDRAEDIPGETARTNAERKGIRRLPMVPLTRLYQLKQQGGHYAFDWHNEPKKGVLWSFLNPAPKVLLPLAYDGRASLLMTIVHGDATALEHLEVEGSIGRCRVGRPYPSGKHWHARAQFDLALSPMAPTALQLRLHGDQRPRTGQRGLGIGDILVAPSAAELILALSEEIVMLGRRLKRAQDLGGDKSHD
jgi:hypothetical protein